MSTKVKNPQEIKKVRELFAQGIALKAIARELKYSINTVRRIIRNPSIDEFPKQVKNFHYRKTSGTDYTSPIDNQQMRIYKNTEGYWRVNYRDSENKSKRELLHIYEAKKLISWKKGYVVHHIDYDKSNCRLDNLHVFKNSSDHQIHHSQMEQTMYSYLKKNNLLDDFYKVNPHLNLTSLLDI